MPVILFVSGDVRTPAPQWPWR